MHSDIVKGLKVILFREDLQIHYCDPISLETVKMIQFKTLQELEDYLRKS